MRASKFVSMMMVIQMKLMKVNRNAKSTMIQEFQLNLESQLIQVSNMKRPPIQFLSMMMVIQMKLMKVIRNQKNMTSQEL
jgi:hypothetical protein